MEPQFIPCLCGCGLAASDRGLTAKCCARLRDRIKRDNPPAERKAAWLDAVLAGECLPAKPNGTCRPPLLRQEVAPCVAFTVAIGDHVARRLSTVLGSTLARHSQRLVDVQTTRFSGDIVMSKKRRKQRRWPKSQQHQPRHRIDARKAWFYWRHYFDRVARKWQWRLVGQCNPEFVHSWHNMRLFGDSLVGCELGSEKYPTCEGLPLPAGKRPHE